MSEARRRWQEKHRRRRVRARWLDPLKRVLSIVLFLAAVACFALAFFVHAAFFGGFLVAMFAGLALRGVMPGEVLSSGVEPGYTGGDGGGDGSN